MKPFLLKLGAFSLLLLLGYLAAFALVLRLHRSALASCQLGKPVDSIIVGDSHGMWSIDDRHIAGLRNISLNAEGYKYSYAKVKHVLRTSPGVEKLYISFGYHNLSAYYDAYIFGPTFGSYIERYLSILELQDFEQFFAYSPRDFPELTRRAVARGLRPGLKRECLLYGVFPTERMTAAFKASSMEKRIRDQFYVDGKVAGTSTSNLENLEKLVDLARRHGVRVTLLSPPVHPEYEKRVPKEYRELLERFVQDKRLEHFAFEDLALGDAHFLPDGDHTNNAGAELTTRRFQLYHETH